MAVIAALSINDGAGTPVAHTFDPDPDLASNLPKWVDRSGGIAVGFPVVTLFRRVPTKGLRAYKITAKTHLPTLEVASAGGGSGAFAPPPTKAYEHIGQTEFVLPERGLLQERKDIYALHTNFLAKSVVKDMVEQFVAVW